MEQLIFGWIDYFLFASLLGLSLCIGCYFGFCSRQDSVDEYLFGGKHMGYIPVAISILSSLLSGITFLGVPTEIYLHGSQYVITLIGTIGNGFAAAYIFLPVFHKLQVASTFEYLELRFSRRLRSLASILYMLSLMIYIPIVIYAPSLAFSQVTGINLHLVAPVICIICITYTSMVYSAIGGVKAVVWTDTIQFLFTMIGMITVLIVGTRAAGGFSRVWEVSLSGQRLDIFDFNISPFVRNTFWGMSIGTFFTSISNSGIGQKFVQRYLSIGNQKDMNKAVLFKTIGTMSIDLCVVFTGLIMYTHYKGCDPITANFVEQSDKIVPFYVLEITKNLPGVSGIFLAGIVSSALSTMSASINTLAGIVYDDFICRWIPDGPNKESTAANIMKFLSVIIGCASIALIFAIEHMGTVLEMSFNLRGAVEGPLLGFFLLGMLCPWVGNKGALTGGFVSIVIMAWIVFGSKWHITNNRIRYTNLPLSIENCSISLNETLLETITLQPLTPDEEPLLIFKLSFLFYILFGSMVTIVVGFVTSCLVNESDLSKIDPDHITPIARRFLPKKKYEEVPIKEILSEKKSKNEKS